MLGPLAPHLASHLWATTREPLKMPNSSIRKSYMEHDVFSQPWPSTSSMLSLLEKLTAAYISQNNSTSSEGSIGHVIVMVVCCTMPLHVGVGVGVGVSLCKGVGFCDSNPIFCCIIQGER